MAQAPTGFLNPDTLKDILEIQPGMHIADFGSGSGAFSLVAADQVGQRGVVAAIDIRESALSNLQAEIEADDIQNIRTIHGDLEAPSGSTLQPTSQDIVLLINILFQVSDQAAVIQEAHRVLKPKGTLLIIDWISTNQTIGPPQTMRQEQEQIKKIATETGFTFSHAVDVGSFHEGMLFIRT